MALKDALKDKFKFKVDSQAAVYVAEKISEDYAAYRVSWDWDEDQGSTVYTEATVERLVGNRTWIIIDEPQHGGVVDKPAESKELTLEALLGFVNESDFSCIVNDEGFCLLADYVSYSAKTVDELQEIVYALRTLSKAENRA